jgi:hypothetical protein
MKKTRKSSKEPAQTADHGPYSLRELARRLDVHASTVADAVARKRLAASVVYVDGEPKIRDIDVAVAEWYAGRRAKVDSKLELPPDDEPDDADVPPYGVSRARREHYLAEIARVEATRLSGGEWVPTTELEALDARYRRFLASVWRRLFHSLPYAIMKHCNSISGADRLLLTGVQEATRQVLTELADSVIDDDENADEDEP